MPNVFLDKVKAEEAMFVRNAWYIAAMTEELGGGSVVARTILGERLALFMTEDGQYAALRDACVHRHAPLSLGRVVGDTIQCPYHGARYGIDGRCRHVPGQTAIARQAIVRSFPVCEKYGFLWVWMGDPARAGEKGTIPEGVAIVSAPELRQRCGLFESARFNYRLLNDNLFDITHAEFVHPETFGGAEVRFYRNAQPGTGLIDRGLTFDIRERSIQFKVHAASLGQEGGAQWRAMMAEAHGLDHWEEAINFTLVVDWAAPCYTTFHLYLKSAHNPDIPAVELHNIHAATPETDKSTHYFHKVGINYGDDEVLSRVTEGTRSIFSQDVKLLEAQQSTLGGHDVFDVDHVSFNGDRLQMEGRRILDRMIAQDQPFPS